MIFTTSQAAEILQTWSHILSISSSHSVGLLWLVSGKKQINTGFSHFLFTSTLPLSFATSRSCCQVAPDVAAEFGELVADPVTSELLHYAEKPETFVRECDLFCSSHPSLLHQYSLVCATLVSHPFFMRMLLSAFRTCHLPPQPLSSPCQVSDRINCGVYIFSAAIFDAIQEVSVNRTNTGASLSATPSFCHHGNQAFLTVTPYETYSQRMY